MPFQHRLYIVRHGQTDWNVAGRLQGQTDIALNETGRGQARRHGVALGGVLSAAHMPGFVASPLSRARETMEIIRRTLGLDPAGYRTDDRLKELGFGVWEGLSWKQIARRDQAAYQARERDRWNYAPQSGESYGQLSGRVAQWLEELEGDTVIVSHGGVGRVLRGILRGLPPGRVIRLSAPQDRIIIHEPGGEREI